MDLTRAFFVCGVLGVAAGSLCHRHRQRGGGNPGTERTPRHGVDSRRRVPPWAAPRSSRGADEKPVHRVRLEGFWMDATEVTNAQLRQFIEATGYVTTAEQAPKLEEIMAQLPPGSPPPPAEMLVPGSLVFSPPSTGERGGWEWRPGANWRQPQGPGSSIAWQGRPPSGACLLVRRHSVLSVGRQAPTDRSRVGVCRTRRLGRQTLRLGGGRSQDRRAARQHLARDLSLPEFRRGWLSHHQSGAIFCPEWLWTIRHGRECLGMGPGLVSGRHIYPAGGETVVVNPQGPDNSYDPREPTVPKRVHRGGSYLCHESYCSGYRAERPHESQSRHQSVAHGLPVRDAASDDEDGASVRKIEGNRGMGTGHC